MIVQETKEKEVLLEMLKGVKKIFLVGCGDCATACEAGGEKDLDNMKMILESEGKKVTGMIMPDTSCHIPDVKNHLKKHAKEIEAAIAELQSSEELRQADVLMLQEMDETGTAQIARELGYNYGYYWY